MKKIIGTFCLFLTGFTFVAQNNRIAPYVDESFSDEKNRLNFVRFKQTHQVKQSEVVAFFNSILFSNDNSSVAIAKTETDDLGFTHYRLNVLYNNVPVANKMIIAHCREGKLVSANGDLYDIIAPINNYGLSESAALSFALKKVNAKKYKFENKAEEQHMREALNDPTFTYYPHATKMIIDIKGKMYFTYVFNIYADVPLYRKNVFVDAASGKILDEQELICHADVPGSAVTKYSGTQTITCDQNGSVFSLKETGRGNGVETYNMNYGTNYFSAINFTNTTANYTATGVDQGAADAHWGAEKTYDYYLTQHNRNSINNNGFKLLSYVHYTVSYSNAFWDGQRMTYGDGNGGSMKIFTALDVCGHEISHGLISNSSNLVYSYESGALNESYADIFGACIENYARPTNWNWKIGEDITASTNGLRNMSNPNAYGDPDTYLGTNWHTAASDNGGVHTNSGVSNFWFYLLTMGGSGTNDIANAYSVSGLGFTNAARIAYRALTVYYTPTTNFAQARNLSIQAAKDLFGNCSNEMMQTMNAWHAVGVGAKYIPGVVAPNFTSSFNTFCTLPANVSFTNTTPNALTYSWDFGDGSAIVTTTNAAHTYTANGTYNVKLKAIGCANAVDSITKNSFVVINVPAIPLAGSITACENAVATLTANGTDVLKWYSDPTGTNLVGTGSVFMTSPIPSNTTFYVANTVPSTPVFGGIMSNTGGGYLTNIAQWLVFNVTQTSTLSSVVVYANSAATRTVELRTTTQVLQSAVVTLTVGMNIVPLNFSLTIGNNFRLGFSTNSPANLYRSNSGVSYPYNIAGCVSIVNSSAGAGAYYWFYKWEVLKEDCKSALIPVNVNVIPQPSVTLAASSTVICVGETVNLTSSPAGGIYGGAGITGSTFNAATLGPGYFTLAYSFTDANGCTGADTEMILVDACTGLNNTHSALASLDVFPNPTRGNLVLRNAFTAEGNKVQISDAAGRLIYDAVLNSNEEPVNLNGVAAGLYLLSVKDASGSTLKTVKVVLE